MKKHTCPVWAGYLLSSPLRKIILDPVTIVSPYVKPAMKVLDFGCSMGFFSLPMARLVGPKGKVLCVDIHEKMLEVLYYRAGRADLADRIETFLCNHDLSRLEVLEGDIDFTLAFAVIHELTDCAKLFFELHRKMNPAAKLLIAESRRQITMTEFSAMIATAENHGFEVIGNPKIGSYRTVLLTNQDPAAHP